MNLKVYKLIVKSKLYECHYAIRANNLQEASKLAREKFARKYKVFGKDVKVSLQEQDLVNHIDEILSKLYKGEDKND